MGVWEFCKSIHEKSQKKKFLKKMQLKLKDKTNNEMEECHNNFHPPRQYPI